MAMTSEDLVEALLEQHFERLAQPVQQLQWRRVREVPGRVRFDHIDQIEIATTRSRCRRSRDCALAHPEDAETGWEHQSLLGSAYGEVHAPLIHSEVDAADGTDTVDIQERRMSRRVHYPANRSNVTGHPRSRLVMARENRLDPVLGILSQRLRDAVDRHTFTPFAVEHLNLEPELLRHLNPQPTELAEARSQNPVARRQRVREGGFPGAGAR